MMNLPNSKTYLLTILKRHLTSLSIMLQRRVSPPRPNPPPKRPLSLPLSLVLFLIVTPLFSRLQMKSQVMKFPVKKFLIVYGSSFKHECHLSFLASQPALCNSSTATPPQSRPRRVLMVYLNPKNSCWICLPLEILKKSPKPTGKTRGLTVLIIIKRTSEKDIYKYFKSHQHFISQQEDFTEEFEAYKRFDIWFCRHYTNTRFKLTQQQYQAKVLEFKLKFSRSHFPVGAVPE